MGFVRAHVLRFDRTRFGTIFTIVLHDADGRHVGEVLLVVERWRGVSTGARIFDIDVHGGIEVRLGRA
ncbi:hypothetical protein BH09MYX1_BH09MYX1_48410 [soil metagenome]